eukprot:666096-Amphidinium_carterae.1
MSLRQDEQTPRKYGVLGRYLTPPIQVNGVADLRRRLWRGVSWLSGGGVNSSCVDCMHTWTGDIVWRGAWALADELAARGPQALQGKPVQSQQPAPARKAPSPLLGLLGFGAFIKLVATYSAKDESAEFGPELIEWINAVVLFCAASFLVWMVESVLAVWCGGKT